MAAVVAAADPVSAASVRVVAATTDVAAFVAAVGGDLVAIETIVPAAVDPEAFEPRPRELDRIGRADLLVRVGLGYDIWLDALISRIGESRLMRGGEAYVDASAGVPLLEVRGASAVEEGGHAHGVANPHYWLDPENAILATAGIAEALARIAPGERDRILANRERFLVDLEARERRWTARLAPVAGAKLIAYHNSWPYFARRFRLDILDFIEPKPGVAPSPAHLARLLAEGRKAGVRAILHEPYEPNDASRFLAEKLNIPLIVPAPSVGSLPGVNDYFDLFEHNVGVLASALGAPSQ